MDSPDPLLLRSASPLSDLSSLPASPTDNATPPILVAHSPTLTAPPSIRNKSPAPSDLSSLPPSPTDNTHLHSNPPTRPPTPTVTASPLREEFPPHPSAIKEKRSVHILSSPADHPLLTREWVHHASRPVEGAVSKQTPGNKSLKLTPIAPKPLSLIYAEARARYHEHCEDAQLVLCVHCLSVEHLDHRPSPLVRDMTDEQIESLQENLGDMLRATREAHRHVWTKKHLVARTPAELKPEDNIGPKGMKTYTEAEPGWEF